MSAVAGRIVAGYPDYTSVRLDLARMLLAAGDLSGYDHLERAVVERESDLVALRIDPRWDGVRHQHRFRQIAADYFARTA